MIVFWTATSLTALETGNRNRTYCCSKFISLSIIGVSIRFRQERVEMGRWGRLYQFGRPFGYQGFRTSFCDFAIFQAASSPTSKGYSGRRRFEFWFWGLTVSNAHQSGRFVCKIMTDWLTLWVFSSIDCLIDGIRISRLDYVLAECIFSRTVSSSNNGVVLWTFVLRPFKCVI